MTLSSSPLNNRRRDHGRAEAYDSARPGYPASAAAYIAVSSGLTHGRSVLDLAAGTGKLTRLLEATGASVVAAEPIASMSKVLRETTSRASPTASLAEALPFRDDSFDAVTVAQAFHWFRMDEALDEIRRVLRPNGKLFLLWNRRDTSRAWVAAFSEILVECGIESSRHLFDSLDVERVLSASDSFGPPTSWRWTWDAHFDSDRLLCWIDSVGLGGSVTVAQQRAARERVIALLQQIDSAGSVGGFPFPFETTIWAASTR